MKSTNIFTREDVIRANNAIKKYGPINARSVNITLEKPTKGTSIRFNTARIRKLKRTAQEINTAYSKARKIVDCG